MQKAHTIFLENGAENRMPSYQILRRAFFYETEAEIWTGSVRFGSLEFMNFLFLSIYTFF